MSGVRWGAGTMGEAMIADTSTTAAGMTNDTVSRAKMARPR